MTWLNLPNSTFARLLVFGAVAVGIAAAQAMSKPQVANLIVKVENGTDEFRDYLKRRGENASGAQTQAAKGRRATGSQTAAAQGRKDELDDALGALNRSTNRLRRKFDATDAWMQTKAQVQQVMDDGRKINQVVARGSYGSQAARLWGVLRSGINDLARAYGIQPMAL
jgi:hypothetical protein